MMLVKILRRKDACSLIVAIILASIVGFALQSTTGDLAAIVSGTKDNGGISSGFGPPGAGWEQAYLFPIVWAVVQIVALEVLVSLVAAVNILIKGTTTPKKKR